MKVCLTGGTGFIGSHIAVELLNHGHEVTILARNPDKVPALATMDGIIMLQGDLTDRAVLDELVKGQDACIHVALNYTRRVGWQVLMDDTLPTVYLAGVAAEAGVKHLIYTSSTSANDSLYMGVTLEEPIHKVTSKTKPHPATFYGATKAANEVYLTAQSHQSDMRVNIIRPGYTFGNPVVEGANTQSDTRFHDIVAAALNNEPVTVAQYDGTQFIWAGHLAELYRHVLHSDFNRHMYFGLGKNNITWEDIGREAIKRCHSSSELIIEDKGYDAEATEWDISDMQRDFGLEFDAWTAICEHLDYYIHQLR